MSDSDSLLSEPQIEIDPAITFKLTPGAQRVVFNCKEYLRHPDIRAAEAGSVIWVLGEDYEREDKKFWRCGLCRRNQLLIINSGTSFTLHHLKKIHNIDKKGKYI
jgi:hypothetical protein